MDNHQFREYLDALWRHHEEYIRSPDVLYSLDFDPVGKPADLQFLEEQEKSNEARATMRLYKPRIAEYEITQPEYLIRIIANAIRRGYIVRNKIEINPNQTIYRLDWQGRKNELCYFITLLAIESTDDIYPPISTVTPWQLAAIVFTLKGEAISDDLKKRSTLAPGRARKIEELFILAALSA